jgi:hypothetical protein
MIIPIVGSRPLRAVEKAAAADFFRNVLPKYNAGNDSADDAMREAIIVEIERRAARKLIAVTSAPRRARGDR